MISDTASYDRLHVLSSATLFPDTVEQQGTQGKSDIASGSANGKLRDYYDKAAVDISVYLNWFAIAASWGQKRRRGVVGSRIDVCVGRNELLSAWFLRPSLAFIQLIASPAIESDVCFLQHYSTTALYSTRG